MDIEPRHREALAASVTIWQSVNYDPERVVSVYAKRGTTEVKFEEVEIGGKTIRTSYVKLGSTLNEWNEFLKDKEASLGPFSAYLLAGLTLDERKDIKARVRHSMVLSGHSKGLK